MVMSLSSKLISSPMVLLALLLLVHLSFAGAEKHIAQRLQSEGMSQCWESLVELRACTGEVILFFLNGGKTYLGPTCCRAIHVIEHSCWAADAMLTALGFTTEEGNLLRGYCDAAAPPPA